MAARHNVVYKVYKTEEFSLLWAVAVEELSRGTAVVPFNFNTSSQVLMCNPADLYPVYTVTLFLVTLSLSHFLYLDFDASYYTMNNMTMHLSVYLACKADFILVTAVLQIHISHFSGIGNYFNINDPHWQEEIKSVTSTTWTMVK